MQKPVECDLADGTEYPRCHSWELYPAAGTTIEDLKNPEFWSHIARKLKTRDKIEVHPQDNAFWALLLVVSSGPLAAGVQVLSYVAAAEDDEISDQSEGYAVGWAGPSHKFRVLRTSDKSVVRHGFESKADAWRFVSKMDPIAA